MTGQTIAHYRVGEKIGAGGMGEVYRAIDTKLGREVALKFLPKDFSRDPQALERFQREARAAAKLNHPNICTIYEIGEHQGTPYISMEYLQGRTLRQQLDQETPAMDDLFLWASQICDALDAAHARGIVHRDLKPANIFIDERRQVKILDFGIAKLIQSDQSGTWLYGSTTIDVRRDDLTMPGTTLGTIPYMSPEQVRGKEVDYRTDIFSCGVVLYEMATGQRPFQGDTPGVLFEAILNKTPLPPATLNRDVPPGLEKIIFRCLEKDPLKRTLTAGELAVDLGRLGTAAGGTSAKALSRLFRGFVAASVILAVVLLGLFLRWSFEPQTPAPLEITERQLGVYSSKNLPGSSVLSPDGKYVALGLRAPGEKRIHLQILESGEVRVLDLPQWFDVRRIAWFADSSKLLLGGGREGNKHGIWVVSLFGGTPRLLHEEGSTPSSSPDGSLIAFIKKGPEIWVMEANGATPRRLIAVGDEFLIGHPSWSPDGKFILFPRRGRPAGLADALMKVEVAGNEVTTVWSDKDFRAYGTGHPPIWLPDGRIIYNQRSNLWQITLDPDTGKAAGPPTQITNWSTDDVSFLRDISVTRDGKQIALFKYQHKQDVYVGKLEANGRRLTDIRTLPMGERWPWPTGWTMDGKAIFFNSSRGGTVDIFKYSIEQGVSEPFVTGPDIEHDAWMTPDGSWVLYKSGQFRQQRLMRISSSGGTAEEVLVPNNRFFAFRCSFQLPVICVLAELAGEADNQLVLTLFDPIEGRKTEILTTPVEWGSGNPNWWDLSPDGSLLVIRPGTSLLRVYDMAGKTIREISTKDKGVQNVVWAPDQKGFLYGIGPVLAYVDFEGRESILWEGGFVVSVLIPSPDGKQLVWADQVPQATYYLLENF